MKKRIIFLFMVLITIIISLLNINSKTLIKKKAIINNYKANIEVTEYTDEVLMNPGKGFTSMYETIDANCINLISTMYYRFDWDQIETADGVYNWNIIDYYINMAKKRNKKIAFGVMNASTSANSPYCTPQWVFEKGAQYTTATNEYGNEQYIPVWDDPIYLEEMNQFIQAFGERYDGNENIAYIDIRGYGNWGEQHNWYLWNSTAITPEQLRDLYIKPYIDNFPNTLLVNPWGIVQYNDVYKWAIDNGVSIRRDGIMEKDNEYVAGQEIFEYAAGKLPTMFEYHADFRNKIEDPNVEKLNMEYLWQYILDWKPTYIEMLPELYQKEPEWVEKIANKVGYYFKYTGGEYKNNITNSENTTVKIDFLNEGVSRLFEPCTVYIGILDEYDNLVKKIKTNIDAQKWLPNVTKQENISISYSDIKNGNYKLAIGLFLNENDDNPRYLIANNGRTDENWYTIGNVTVKNIEVSDIGDLDCDCDITAFDAYLALKYSIEDSLEQKIIRVADMDKDTTITAFDAYKILKTSIEVVEEDDNYTNNRIYVDKNGTTIAKKQGISEPWLPTATAEILSNNIEEGLVIKDEKDNEWVWVEVPKTITANAKTEAAIEANLKNYVSTIYTRPGGYSDKYSSGKGLTEEEYLEKKSEMLKSIKYNGGFYIGRYEAGVEGRNLIKKYYDYYGNELTDISNGYYIYSGTWDETTPGKTVIKNCSAPYLWVNNEQAENLAEELATGETNTTLPFGIQWDLALKFIKENSSLSETDLSSNSTGWGNYLNSEFTSESNSGYSLDYGISWKLGAYTKSASREMCFATGACNNFAKNNIYDLAGNVSEWTLEKYADSGISGVTRGGSYGDNGYMKPAFSRNFINVNDSSLALGFRAVLY